MPMLSVAPEGTLSHGRCVLKFKTGAFVAGTPVVPFVLRYKLTPHNPAWTIIIPFWHVVSWPSLPFGYSMYMGTFMLWQLGTLSQSNQGRLAEG